MGTRFDTAAAPATVTGERSSEYATEAQALGRWTEAETREPGDLPRAVVLFPAGVRWGLRGKPSRRQCWSRRRGAWCEWSFLKAEAFACRLLDQNQENVML